ncbi:MAG: hypothetical protein HOB93_01595 [Candidatus Marinimicrobia bacterium]|jgi:hypothetical protein|nr:hypothetical protein [Candidatus Neomarinimicrobiota bacterium]
MGRHLLLFISLLYTTGCASKSILLNHPNLVSIYFENKIQKLEKKASPTKIEKRKILKLKNEYAFGILMEKNDRLIGQDYSKGLEGYHKANIIFNEAKIIGSEILITSFPNFELWLKGNSKITFSHSDIFDLYWLAAAYGGAIKSSRGNPFELVHLPSVGKMLKTAISLDPDWGNGVLHTAMMSYTSSRPDLSGKSLIDSVSYYFNKAVLISDSLYADPFMIYAESIDKPFQNKGAYEEKLNFILNMDTDRSAEFELGNIITKKRAKWLLTKTNEMFLE